MEIFNQYHEAIAVLLARVFLGLLLFFQGYDAVFKVKVNKIIATYQSTFAQHGIPEILTRCGVWFTSYSELFCGLLLVFGLFQYLSLYIIVINLLLASIAFGINTAMWDTTHVFTRLVLVIFLLLIPQAWSLFSLDYFINL